MHRVQGINDRVHEITRLKRSRPMFFPLLTRHDTTRAEETCAKYYTIGDIILFILF